MANEKKRKDYAEFRFYEKPTREPVEALLGEGWIRDYGKGIGYLHFHNLVEIGICIEGKGQVALNKDLIDYTGGSFTYIPHNYLHTTNSEDVCQWEFLFFDVNDLLDEFLPNAKERGKNLKRILESEAHVMNREEDPQLWNLVKMITDLMREKTPNYKETVKGLLFAYVMQVAAKSKDNQAEERNDNNSKIIPALDYISRMYKEDIRIVELAECCHLSETHFRRIFQESMSMSPVEYINLARVQAACDLMKKTDYQMEEVAMKVGYQTMSTFNRNFKQIIGTSPYHWKKKMEAEGESMEHYHISAKMGWR